MSEIHFTDNYHDVSTNSGFQFEFYCERCHDAWRSPFDRHAAGTAEDLLSAASNLFGGLFGSARTCPGGSRGASLAASSRTAAAARGSASAASTSYPSRSR